MSLHSQNVGSFHEQALLDIACEKFSDEIDEYKVAALHLMVDKAFSRYL